MSRRSGIALIALHSRGGPRALSASSAALARGTPVPRTPESNPEAIASVQTHADYLWTLVAACLVFLMQAGFALVETGLTRAKNAVNICMKNLMDFSVGSLSCSAWSASG